MTPYEKGEALLCCGRCCVPFEVKPDWDLNKPDICIACFERCYTFGITKSSMFPIPFGEW